MIEKKSQDLFLIIYRNKFLKTKIFNEIRNSNSKLNYVTYNYYEFSLLSIIKIKNKSLLLEKLINYSNIINNNNNNNNNNNINNFIYLNFECLFKILKCKKEIIDLKTFVLIFNLFENEIKNLFLVNSNNSCSKLMVSINNLEILNFIINKFNPIINDYSSLVEFKFDFNNQEESILKFKLLLNQCDGMKNIMEFQKSLFKILEMIVENKLSKYLGTLVLEKFNDNKQQLNILSSVDNKLFLSNIIEYSDEWMFIQVIKMFDKKLSKHGSIVDPYDSKINIYNCRVSIKALEQFYIKPNILMKSSMLELLKVTLSLPEDFIKKLKPFSSSIIVRDPLIANFILNNHHFDSIINTIHFSPACIYDNLSNAIQLFSKSPNKKWRLSSSKHLNIDKFQLFKDHNINVQGIFNNSNHKLPIKSDDLALVVLYSKQFKPPLNLLKSAARQNLKDIVEYLVSHHWDDWFILQLLSKDSIFNGFHDFFYLLELSILFDHQSLFENCIVELENIEQSLSKPLLSSNINNNNNQETDKFNQILSKLYSQLLKSPPSSREYRFKFFKKLQNLPLFNQFINQKTIEHKSKNYNHQISWSKITNEKLKEKLYPFVLLNWIKEIKNNQDDETTSNRWISKIEFFNLLIICLNYNQISFIDSYLKNQLFNEFGKKNSMKMKLVKNSIYSNPGFILYLISIDFISNLEFDYLIEKFLVKNSDLSLSLLDFIFLKSNGDFLDFILFRILKMSIKFNNNLIINYLLLKFNNNNSYNNKVSILQHQQQNHKIQQIQSQQNNLKLDDIHFTFIKTFGLINYVNDISIIEDNNSSNPKVVNFFKK